MESLNLALAYSKANNGFDLTNVLSFITLFAIMLTLTLAFSMFSLSTYCVNLQKYLEIFCLNNIQRR